VEILVFVKAVPDLEVLRVDPATGRAVREGIPLRINPFDQRALRVALELRRPGETVTVVSMGPPAAEAPLHEARGQGADRAILVSDPALAGSDSLVTARVLRRAIDRLGGDLVLMGRWSTDSETGQVPPQLAELLGRPFVPAARRLTRLADDVLEADVDTEDGWSTCRVRPPAVVSVGEKIAKPKKLTPEEIQASASHPVEIWSLSDLGVDASTVGRGASPTFVTRLIEETVPRTPHRFDAGSPEERVRAAVTCLTDLLRRPSFPSPHPAGIPTRAAPPSGRFLFLVTGPDGRLSLPALDMLSAVRHGHPEWNAEAVGVGDAPGESERRLLGQAGADRLWSGSDPDRPVDPANAVQMLHTVARNGPLPVGIAMLADQFGRSVAGRLSAREGWGLTGDATGIALDAEGRPLYRKPAFGGRWIAEIGTRAGPALVTVRRGAFPRFHPSESPALSVESVPFVRGATPMRFTGGGVERDPSWGDVNAAPVLLVAGQGVGGPEGVRALREAAPSFGATVGATRLVVDLGWAPRQLQIGLTGLAVEPRLAILVGVGGSLNHLVGLRRAGVLVALNLDPAAAVFGHADVGIVGDWQELLPLLARELGPTLPGLLDPAP
jgi:electron transfer flavoprotein alpha subunit